MINLISWPKHTRTQANWDDRDGSFSHFRNRSSRQHSNGRSFIDVCGPSSERDANASRFVVCDSLIYHSICLTHFCSFSTHRSPQNSEFLIISTSIVCRNFCHTLVEGFRKKRFDRVFIFCHRCH